MRAEGAPWCRCAVVSMRVCVRTPLPPVCPHLRRMLDSLPEWRRALGRRVMNEVTRLVVVSWGRASQEKKEAAADKLGVSRGA